MASWPRPPMAPSPRRLVVPGPPIASRAHQTRVSLTDLCDAPLWSHRGGWPSTPYWSRGPLRSARTWGKAPSVRSWIASRHARPCSTWGRPPISSGGGGNQGIKDDRGDKCGHAFSQPHCWWAQLVLYLTESGGHCAAMEEHLIAIFKRYVRGLRG